MLTMSATLVDAIVRVVGELGSRSTIISVIQERELYTFIVY